MPTDQQNYQPTENTGFFARVEHHPRMILLTTALALVAFLTTIYLYNQNLKLANELALATIDSTTQSETPPHRPAETPTDPTANWQTYTNEEFGFSFKYPLDVEALHDSTANPIHVTNYNPSDISSSNIELDYISITVSAETLLESTDHQEYLTQRHTRPIQDGTTSSTISSTITPYSQYNLTGYQYDTTFESVDHHISLLHQNTIVNFTLRGSCTGCDYHNYPRGQQALNQILSTFQFIEQTSQSRSKYLITNGNVFAVDSHGNQKMILNKEDYKESNNSESFNFTQIQTSPDQSKLLILAQGSFSLPQLYYLPQVGNPAKFVSIAESVWWSPDGRFFAYLSKNADAGPLTIIEVYDTNKNTITPYQNKHNTHHTYLGFNDLTWLPDSSGVNVSFQAYDNLPHGEILEEGNTIIKL